MNMNIDKGSPRNKFSQTFQVKFYFSNEQNNKLCQLLINPFSALINYKSQLQNATKLDLYGKKLIFKYVDINMGQNFNIQYLQEIVQRTKCQLKPVIDIQISYQQIGG